MELLRVPLLIYKTACDNNTILNSYTFYPGEDLYLKLQVVEDDTDQQFLVPSFPVPALTLLLPGSPQNVQIISPAVVVDPKNSSIISAVISDTNSNILTSGNMRLIIESGEVIGLPDLSTYTAMANAKLTVNGVNYLLTTASANGVVEITSITGLARGMRGTVSSDTVIAVNVCIVDIVQSGSNYLLQMGTLNLLTRMAQLKNGIKRLTPNPVV